MDYQVFLWLKNFFKILIIDKHNHIDGNCYDYIDNKYGTHHFHINDNKVFNYINKFCKFSIV